MFAIGLTGGIGTGKSLAGELLAKHFETVDADLLVHELYRTHEGLIHGIQAEFGERAVLQGEVDRSYLREVVFQNPARLKALSAVVHPVISEALRKRISLCRELRKVVIFQIPLLFENHWERELDHVILLVCSEETQLRRILARDQSTEANARKIMATQMPQSQKILLADTVIENMGSPLELEARLEAWRIRTEPGL